MHFSPFLVGEDELAQLEVSQDDAGLVAVRHGLGHLSEEPAGVLLVQPAAALHQGVHVPKVLVQEDVGLALTQDDVPDTGHVPVGWQDPVGSDLLLVHPHVKHLGERRERMERVQGFNSSHRTLFVPMGQLKAHGAAA